MIKIGLVWRYNVWKSSIFNRLVGSHRAIVTDIKWTTREIFREKAKIDDRKFLLLDSPGLEEEQEIEKIKKIIDEADIILFVVDWKQGLNPQDEVIAKYIFEKWKDKNTILVVNKLDSKVYTDKVYQLLADFYTLWFEDIIWLSAKQNEGFEDLKDLILKKVKQLNLDIEDDNDIEELLEEIPIAIVWRPNTGKSTLLNTICWEEIAKVEDRHWTTLDYISCEIIKGDKKFTIYDTAGIRRKWKIHWLEKIAYHKTLKLLEFKKPVTIVLFDIYEWVTHRDLTIVWDLIKLKIPLIVAVNKIDKLTDFQVRKKFNDIVKALHFAKWIPIVPISAKNWKGINQLFNWVEKVYKEYYKRISTSELNRVIQTARLQKPPRFPKNKICKVYYATQPEVAPPTFVFFVNKEDYVNFAFKRWLENVIRENFWFIWCPLEFIFREKESKS